MTNLSFWKVFFLTSLLSFAVIINAHRKMQQFYPTVVYISKSSLSMTILYLQSLVFVYLAGKIVSKIFYGSLANTEVEQLLERFWYALTETCLVFTIFREDFTPKFVAQFTLLLFLKIFHWLTDERLEIMHRTPVIPWLFHVRIVSITVLLGSLDITHTFSAYETISKLGHNVQIVFGFEYAILLVFVIKMMIKYASYLHDVLDFHWENKTVFMLYIDLVMGILKLVLYFVFMVCLLRMYSVPLFAIRSVYSAIKNVRKNITDVIMSRRALRNLTTLYPDATQEQLSGEEICIICRLEMESFAKTLPCGHIFHTSCLRAWFQRQQTCPTCRYDVLSPATPTVQEPQQQPQQTNNFRLCDNCQIAYNQRPHQVNNGNLDYLETKTKHLQDAVTMLKMSVTLLEQHIQNMAEKNPKTKDIAVQVDIQETQESSSTNQ